MITNQRRRTEIKMKISDMKLGMGNLGGIDY